MEAKDTSTSRAVLGNVKTRLYWNWYMYMYMCMCWASVVVMTTNARNQIK